jgi:hypothetical protein
LDVIKCEKDAMVKMAAKGARNLTLNIGGEEFAIVTKK